MKKLWVTILLLLLAINSWAADYKSSFGFSYQLPKSWVVLTKSEVKQSWSSDKDRPAFLTREQYQEYLDKIQKGELEIYYNHVTANDFLTDTVNVLKREGIIPQKSQLKQYCDNYRAGVTKMFGKEITIYDCKLIDVSGKKALYIDSDGPEQGIRCIYSKIQVAPNSVISLSMTSKLSSFSSNKIDFNALVKSIRY